MNVYIPCSECEYNINNTCDKFGGSALPPEIMAFGCGEGEERIPF